MYRKYVVLVLCLSLISLPAVAAAQGADEAMPPLTNAPTVSETLRSAGYPVGAAEAAYLDADEQLTDRFVTPLLTVELHAGYVSDAFSRELVLAELRQISALELDSNGTPPPASLAELAQLGRARRAAIREAAIAWQSGLEASDPGWVARGAASYASARQAESDWYAALRRWLGVAP